MAYIVTPVNFTNEFGILQAVAIAIYILPALNLINQPILYLACISVQMTLAMAYTTEYTVMMDKSD